MTELITRQDIAKMCAIKPRYVSEVLEKRKDFPRPVLALTQQIVRWSKLEIESWLASQAVKSRQ